MNRLTQPKTPVTRCYSSHLMGVVGLVCFVFFHSTALSQKSELPGMEEIAAAYIHNMGRKWEGQRVPIVDESPRPESTQVLHSNLWPLSVHANESVSSESLQSAMRSLESAYWSLELGGWSGPVWDGGRGGTDGFDLYLVKSQEHPGDAFTDARTFWSYLDTASTFAVVDVSRDEVASHACVVSAYAQATLLANNPAEARSWHRATAEWMAMEHAGSSGCSDGVEIQQRHTERSWIQHDDAEGAGGALWISMLNSRHGGNGIFIRDVWDVAKQRTWEGQTSGLRGSPDLWESLNQLLERKDTTLQDTIVDFAVVRYFTGSESRERGLLMPVLAGLQGATKISYQTDWRSLPLHTEAHEPALEPQGTAYALIDTKDIPDSATLKVWLRGEPGVEWSLTASSIVDGKESSRLVAPSRKGVPHSFLPLELMDSPDSVMIAVTNLSRRLPDADMIDENVRSFRLIVDAIGASKED